MMCFKMYIDVSRVGVCNKFEISVIFSLFANYSQRASHSLNDKVSLGVDSKREEHAHLARLPNQRGCVYFNY